MTRQHLRIGTRASQLALWQANWIKSELEKQYPGVTIELVKIKTLGDKILDVPLAQVGGKGLFVKEIEEAMLRGDIDLAVHSMKDVPTEFPDGLGLVVTTLREDPRDALISRGVRFSDLPMGARIGTSALRRQAQLLAVRPDLEMVIIRGNVETRIRKLEEDKLDAVILAAAGLNRLGFSDAATELLSVDLSIPAIGQGALGLECRLDDHETRAMLSFLNHSETAAAVSAERALLKRCEGGCQVPIAAHATVSNGVMTLTGLIGSVNGATIVKAERHGSMDDAVQIGTELADQLLNQGGRQILEEVYQRALL
ncbi:MAG: hydroxymethylbilane synthase [Trichlorobacter sp.]